jgi:uncharacterized membrane protein (DUF106 family)
LKILKKYWRNMIKKALSKIVLYFGVFLLLSIMLFPNLRGTIGNAMGVVLNPLLSVLPIHIIIFILAAITGLYASLIQKYTRHLYPAVLLGVSCYKPES